MNCIEEQYRAKCATPSDIHEHLPTLRQYAAQCQHVTEFGVRAVVSTWALLAGLQVAAGRPRTTLRSVDLAPPSAHGSAALALVETSARAAGIDFRFTAADDRLITIEPTDLLFIDTWHVYEQLLAELERHADRVRRWIILHDTETFGVHGETPGHDGLNRAATEFLCTPGCAWRVKEQFKNNNGLTVLERVDTSPRPHPRSGEGGNSQPGGSR